MKKKAGTLALKRSVKNAHPSHRWAHHLRADVTPDDVLLSIRSAAEVVGIDRVVLRRLLRDRDVGPSAWRGEHPLWSARDLWWALVSNGSSSPDDLSPRERKAHYSAQILRMKHEEQCARLVPATDVAETRARIARLMNRMLDEALSNLAACGATPHMVERIRLHFSQCRELLRDYAGTAG